MDLFLSFKFRFRDKEKTKLKISLEWNRVIYIMMINDCNTFINTKLTMDIP